MLFSKLIAIGGTVILSAIGVVADVLIKQATRSGNHATALVIAGAGVYAGTALGWYILMKRLSLTAIGGLYPAATLCLLVIAGAIFGERVTIRDAVGLVFVVAAIVLLAHVD